MYKWRDIYQLRFYYSNFIFIVLIDEAFVVFEKPIQKITQQPY